MRAYQITQPGSAEMREVEDPQPGPGEVLLKVAGAGICHSDLHILHAEEALFPTPMTLGHEVAGWVSGVGEGVEGWDTGTPVAVHPVWGCGQCRQCVLGAENYCETFPRGTVPGPGLGLDGGMAALVTVPARHLVDLGDLDPVRSAPLTDAGLTPYHAIRISRSRISPSSTVVVIGIGGLGHMAVQILRSTTTATIVALDTDERRLEQARELGADETLMSDSQAAGSIMAMTGGVGADLVLDFVGVTPTLATAAAAIRSGGQITVVGLGGGELPFRSIPVPVELPWGTAIARPYGGSRRDLQEVVALALQGQVDVDVTRLDLDDAAKALDELEAGEILGRAVLVPSAS